MVFLPARCQTKAALAPGSMNTRIALDPLKGLDVRPSMPIFTAPGQEGAAQVEVPTCRWKRVHPTPASRDALAGDASRLSSGLVCSTSALCGFPGAVTDPGVAVFCFPCPCSLSVLHVALAAETKDFSCCCASILCLASDSKRNP